ncbi:5-oxoprolinase subunit PxpB [Virgibacillus sp. NKC19-3]|uniref:5-oxoprolinase subunit PxpB n=1 Tax=Virgibacillus saliphilus TaxID=2831674 RepID=UPI001C9AFD35|nr:5-oxoprolinase subunit PxpB [Virgibacillus sp. NKC19-3]MBY7144143.1 5-oxoprolinase subunit PxpB [Virgibacillus sp. NKC19-3]
MFSLQAVGDSALKVNFPGVVSPELNAEIQGFCMKLEELAIVGVVEWVPAFDSVTIYYEPHKIKYKAIAEKVKGLRENSLPEKTAKSRIFHVPVFYGNEYGPDLERVAAFNKLDISDVVEMHQKPEYLVYMIGFLPGFPYLGGLDRRIATPRLKEPRKSMAAGSVGIAHEQTGIYPVESPGGWNIIGKTPIPIFDKNAEDAFLFQAGDRIRFYRVSKTEFEQIITQTENG